MKTDEKEFESELKQTQEKWDKYYTDNQELEEIFYNSMTVISALLFILAICVIAYCICK